MNCRKCEAHLSAYIDQELDPRTTREVSSHLASCAGCRARAAGLERLAGILAGLPRYEMSRSEQRQLMEGLRRGIKSSEAEERRARASLFPRLATASAILVTMVVVTIALMTTPTSHKTSEPANAPLGAASEEAVDSTADSTGTKAGNGTLAAGLVNSNVTAGITNPALASLLPTPRLVKSSNDYDKQQVEEYSKDMGTRLDFYSDIWYQPASGSGASGTLSGADQSAMQAHYSNTLENLALESGEDPESLQRSLSIAAAQIPPGKYAVPCFVERAFCQGQPVWIISYSVPEDSQLFTNPEVASLVNLAKQMSASGSLQGSAMMDALAATISPGAYTSVSTTSRNQGEPAAVLDLQALIAGLAENNNLASYLRQLSELDSDELVSLVSGEVGFPVQISAGLLDMLTWRVWVINPESGQILFRPSR